MICVFKRRRNVRTGNVRTGNVRTKRLPSRLRQKAAGP